jgi:hypothetical protein
MKSFIFNFDNLTDVGDIDEYIEEKFFNEKKKLYKVKLNIQNNLVINVYKFKNIFPLLINEIRKFFRGINVTQYNIATIEGVKYLVYENMNNISLNEYNNKNSIFTYHNIQYILCLNYILCIHSNFEKNIIVKPLHFNPYVIDVKNSDFVTFKTIKEKSFKFKIIDHIISKSILDKWFNGSLEEFQKKVKFLVNEIDPYALHQEMVKICYKYDDTYVSWANIVRDMIIRAKGF